MTFGGLPASLLRLLVFALVLHLLMAAVAFLLPETGDQRSFVFWAHESFRLGISKAYSVDGYGYDWLPFYLYLSKNVFVFIGWTVVFVRQAIYSASLKTEA